MAGRNPSSWLGTTDVESPDSATSVKSQLTMETLIQLPSILNQPDTSASVLFFQTDGYLLRTSDTESQGEMPSRGPPHHLEAKVAQPRLSWSSLWNRLHEVPALGLESGTC